MRKLSVFILSFFLLAGISHEGYSQLNRRQIKKNRRQISSYKGRKKGFGKERRYNYIGLSVNGMNYFGDLSPSANIFSTDFSQIQPGAGLFWGHRFGPRYTLRTSFNYGGIRGNDFEAADPNDSDAIFRYARNLQFRNRIKELSVVGMFDLFKNENTYISRVQFTPFIYAGVAVIHHNPQAYVGENSGLAEAGEWVDLQEIGTEGQYANLLESDVNHGIEPYKKWQFSIPVGIGIRYRLNQVMDITFETGVRYLFFDYIDDVSGNYVDPGVFDSDLARYLHDRSLEATEALSGDSRNNEAFQSFLSGRVSTITGRDGNTYQVIDGYGSEFPDNLRGNDNENDIYVVTSLKLSFVVGGKFLRAKFR